jgi:hypothetical protein
MDQALEIVIELGLNRHPDVIKELEHWLEQGYEPEEAVSRLSELAYSMDDRDYQWMLEQVE